MFRSLSITQDAKRNGTLHIERYHNLSIGPIPSIATLFCCTTSSPDYNVREIREPLR